MTLLGGENFNKVKEETLPFAIKRRHVNDDNSFSYSKIELLVITHTRCDTLNPLNVKFGIKSLIYYLKRRKETN